jgi:8-oxo-dGTP pyrophosphatase MutT (NUDIX family)
MNNFNAFIESLKPKIAGPLPGLDAQLQMAGLRRLMLQENMAIPEDASPAGVLIFLYPIDDEPYILFMKRTDDGGVHSGQISFPGGKSEKSDANIEFTALREANEEVGVQYDRVTLLGRLTDLYIPPSRFLVTPVVGYSMHRHDYHADPSEVAEIIELPLRSFREENAITTTHIYFNEGLQFDAPCFKVDDYIIWGATAMILNEFLQIIGN